MKHLLQCTWCKGTRTMRVIMCRSTNRGDGIPRYSGVREDPCSQCQGSGTVSEEHRQREDAAKALLTWRVQEGEYRSQRECAAQMEIDFQEYAQLERGEKEPWEKYGRTLEYLKRKVKS